MHFHTPFTPRAKPSLATLLCAVVFSVLISGCDTPQTTQSFRIFAFGTLIDVTLADVSQQQATKAEFRLNAAFQAMHREWHAWEPGTLNQINVAIKNNQTSPIQPELEAMMQQAKTLAIQSDHLFNPAIGKLIELWGFHRDIPTPRPLPAEARIEALVAAAPTMANLKIENGQLTSSNSAVQLDFGGFAKGYGIDIAINTLRSLGIKNAIINAGGDLRAIGLRGAKPWRIGIRDPHQPRVLASAQIYHDESVFTSGNYERNYEQDDQFVHHIIDPRTGHPSMGTSSVTVIHKNAAKADGAATALFIAGPKNWHRIAKRMGIKFVLLIDAQGDIYMSPAMEKRITFVNDEQRNIHISEPLSDAPL